MCVCVFVELYPWNRHQCVCVCLLNCIHGQFLRSKDRHKVADGTGVSSTLVHVVGCANTSVSASSRASASAIAGLGSLTTLTSWLARTGGCRDVLGGDDVGCTTNLRH